MGVGVKAVVGAFLVGLSAQLGAFANEVLEKVTVSIQASEMMTIDGYLTVAAIEERRTRFPRDQAEFERTVRDQLSSRGRDPTRDRWSKPYVYEPRGGRGYSLSCGGPDKRVGTEDDIVVERDQDHVQLNRDPAQIMEQAIQRKQRLDADVAQKVRELVAQAKVESKRPAEDPRLQEETKALARELARLL
jgi:hypothetical protein